MLRASSNTVAVVLCLVTAAAVPGRAQQPSAGGRPSTGSGQVPSTGSGQVPSTGSGQVPSTSSGQVRSTGSGQGVPSIEERTTGMQKLDGYVPVYWDERTG